MHCNNTQWWVLILLFNACAGIAYACYKLYIHVVINAITSRCSSGVAAVRWCLCCCRRRRTSTRSGRGRSSPEGQRADDDRGDPDNFDLEDPDEMILRPSTLPDGRTVPVLLCDVGKAVVGVFAASLICLAQETTMFTHGVGVFHHVTLFVFDVVASLPIAVILSKILAELVASGFVSGKFVKGGLMEALLVPGRYNPRLRVNMDRDDCMDFRSELSTEEVEETTRPKGSWWVVQTLTWTLCSSLAALVISAMITAWDVILKDDSPTTWIPRKLQAAMHLTDDACDSSAVIVVVLAIHFALAIVCVTMCNFFNRYHGRTVHAALDPST